MNIRSAEMTRNLNDFCNCFGFLSYLYFMHFPLTLVTLVKISVPNGIHSANTVALKVEPVLWEYITRIYCSYIQVSNINRIIIKKIETVFCTSKMIIWRKHERKAMELSF